MFIKTFYERPSAKNSFPMNFLCLIEIKERDKMKEINYVIWQEDKYYVARCLNVEVSSFGESIDESIKNLKEAVELYFEGEIFTY